MAIFGNTRIRNGITAVGAAVAVFAVAMAVATFSGAGSTAASPLVATTATADGFTYQGRLTSPGGQPVANGAYTITLRLYETDVNGSALASDTQSVSVSGGLFTMVAQGLASVIDGRDLFVGIAINADPELTPRQRIMPVPYATSLRPGAVVSASLAGSFQPVLSVRNTSTLSQTGPTIEAEARGGAAAISGFHDNNQGGDPTGHAIYGLTNSTSTQSSGVYGQGVGGGNGVSGYSFSNNPNSAGVRAIGGNQSAAIYASGRIASNQDSKLWIPGMTMVTESDNNPGVNIDRELINGGARIFATGAVPGSRKVAIPMNVPAYLYGQNVKIRTMKVYFVTQDASAFIDTVTLYHFNPSTGHGIVYQDTENWTNIYTSFIFDIPGYSLSATNFLTSFEFNIFFSNTTKSVTVYGIELTLGHE